MLILTRKPGESLYIGDDIKITIVEIKGHQIRVGIEAPQEFKIYREEIYLQILEENKEAAAAAQASESDLSGLRLGFDSESSREGDQKKPRLPSLSGFSVGRAERKPTGAGREKSSTAGPEVVVRRKGKK